VAALYVVSTPIGNLGDMTHRARRGARRADVVLAEDTRRTGGAAEAPRDRGAAGLGARAQRAFARAPLVVEMLREGKEVALVSDAGTPLLSDPGARIVRGGAGGGYDVVPVPGASALLAALVASGLAADRFTFYGFIPRKGRRADALLEEIGGLPHTAVLYESPQRVAELLRDLLDVAGPSVAWRWRASSPSCTRSLPRHPMPRRSRASRSVAVKGEIVVVVEGAPRRWQRSGDEEEDGGRARAGRGAARAGRSDASAAAKELRQRL
jgi:16S rRNA (cytidine1402-2'-O)-methyltransferase